MPKRPAVAKSELEVAQIVWERGRASVREVLEALPPRRNLDFKTVAPLAWTQIWQVTLVAGMVAAITKLLCSKRPHLAYVLWLVVLVKCLTPPLWSSPTGVFSWAAGNSASVADAASVGSDPHL